MTKPMLVTACLLYCFCLIIGRLSVLGGATLFYLIGEKIPFFVLSVVSSVFYISRTAKAAWR